ncbi:MAG TPA: type VI secretion system-associated protein TagF [Steroidobacteraceae bacterium]|nr:type VI secretion system-associated protein TagF [Steroidobacteraceae bacterium]
MSAELQCGFFGKLPVLGDFLSRRLSQGFLEPWDQWLRQSVAIAREQLGVHWDAWYRNAAPWRFALEAGVAGPRPVIGALLASSDRVGRQFPLTLAVELPHGYGALELATTLEHWFETAEALLLAGTTGGYEAQAFDAAVCAMPAVLDPALPDAAAADVAACQQFLLAHGAFRLPLGSGGFTQSLAAMCAGQLARTAPPLGLFWCEATSAEPALLATRALPAPQFFADMLRAPRHLPASVAVGTPAPLIAAEATVAAPSVRRHAVVAREQPNMVHAVLAGSELTGVLALLARSDLDENSLKAGLEASSGSAANMPAADAGIHVAGCLHGAASRLFFWCGGASIYRLRGRELERLASVEPATTAGGSLLDLLQAPAAESHPLPSLHTLRVDSIDAQDRILLCGDGTYPTLSWGQLVSALDEDDPQHGIERLVEALGERMEGAAPALILLCDNPGDSGNVTARTAHTPVASQAA